MPCDTYFRRLSPEERKRQEEERLKSLAKALLEKRAKLVIAANGAVAFSGRSDDDRKAISDVCAYRKLKAAGSWELRQAVAAAQTATGRTVNEATLAAGTHSHDGGATWESGE